MYHPLTELRAVHVADGDYRIVEQERVGNILDVRQSGTRGVRARIRTTGGGA